MCQCEDRPCCGHAAEERADDAYWAEKAYYGEYDDFYYESDEDEDEESEESYESERTWVTEDSALESSLFGDC